MPKFSALIAVVVALLVVPALASAAPTGTQITSPAATAFVTFNQDKPGTLHVAGTTVGGTGNVDLRCYHGGKSPLVASNVPVMNGAFSTDVAITGPLLAQLGYPYPFCMLRAVPTGTVPSAPPDMPSDWQGAFIGWGWHSTRSLGAEFGSNAGTMVDYYVGRAQSGAFNEFNSIAQCGLCETALFIPGSEAPSNPIWYYNAGVTTKPFGITTRTGAQVDGADAYTSFSAYYNGSNHHLGDNPGFPRLFESHTVDPITGDVTINESAPFVWCAEDRSMFPATDASCASFTDTGVHYERSIHVTDSGHLVTIVDHWKSVDGKSHELDAIYEDTERSDNAGIAGHEGRANFTWTQDGMTTYPANTQIALPPSTPATMLVKTDASTPDFGDNMNPFGAMVFGSKPSELKLLELGNAVDKTGEWQSRYQRTIPAGGEITIAVAYTHDFALDSVKSKAKAVETALAAPTVVVDSPADGNSIDAATAHVTGSASSPDGQVTVAVNGVATSVGPDGHWSADVPLSDGANNLVAAASNKIGVTTSASVSVTHQPTPAAPGTSGSSPALTTAAAVAIVAKPVRCIVPKLRGKTVPKAKRLLKRAHCRLGKVVGKTSSRVKPGHIVATRFKAGTRHRVGTRVRVTIAKARRA